MKKQQKKRNPFKVDHVRSIKLKAKAKQYTGHLKQLKAVVSEKVTSTNEQLAALEEVVRQAPKKSNTQLDNAKRTELTEEQRREIASAQHAAIDRFNNSQNNEADALDKLCNWTCKE